jgi:uncharacterized phage protein (TIGR01671 family)
MREIKFRAWDKQENEMLLNPTEACEYQGFPADTFQEVIEDDRFELMQYTGLKDKNGKDIYEGDIIEYYGRERIVIGEMEFDDMADTCIYGWVFGSRQHDPSDSVVAGNIYENPDLLTK